MMTIICLFSFAIVALMESKTKSAFARCIIVFIFILAYSFTFNAIGMSVGRSVAENRYSRVMPEIFNHLKQIKTEELRDKIDQIDELLKQFPEPSKQIESIMRNLDSK